MPAMGKKYANAKTIKVPPMPQPSDGLKVKSGKLTASAWGRHKHVGTVTLSRKG